MRRSRRAFGVGSTQRGTDAQTGMPKSEISYQGKDELLVELQPR
jgi:hypothetical protein